MEWQENARRNGIFLLFFFRNGIFLSPAADQPFNSFERPA